MRKIKFRGFDPINQKIIPWEGMQAWAMNSLENKNIMQFSGLLDKNDVEIYEGDIVKSKCCEECEKPIKILKVIFYEGCFELRYIKDWKYSDLYSLLSGAGDIEIIGNIYENPELLK